MFIFVRDKVLNGDSNGACSEASNILLLTIINPLHPITVVSVRDGFQMSVLEPKLIKSNHDWPLTANANSPMNKSELEANLQSSAGASHGKSHDWVWFCS